MWKTINWGTKKSFNADFFSHFEVWDLDSSKTWNFQQTFRLININNHRTDYFRYWYLRNGPAESADFFTEAFPRAADLIFWAGCVVQTVLAVNEPVQSNRNIPGHFRWFWNFLGTSIFLEKCCQIGISLRSIMFWVSWDIYRSPQAINISKPKSFIYLSWQGNKDANEPICPEFFFRKLSPRQTQFSTIQEVPRI